MDEGNQSPIFTVEPKKILLSIFFFGGWVLGSREPPEVCLPALIYPNASLCLWKKLLEIFAMEYFHIQKKKNIPSIHPRPSFQKPHQGWFLLGYLWTSESLFLPLDAVQMSYCRCLGTKAVPTHRLADDKQVPKLSITDNAKENGHCLEKKGSSAELI